MLVVLLTVGGTAYDVFHKNVNFITSVGSSIYSSGFTYGTTISLILVKDQCGVTMILNLNVAHLMHITDSFIYPKPAISDALDTLKTRKKGVSTVHI